MQAGTTQAQRTKRVQQPPNEYQQGENAEYENRYPEIQTKPFIGKRQNDEAANNTTWQEG